MAIVSATLTGGDKLIAHLKGTAERLATGRSVAVGFIDKATYPPDRQERFERRLAKYQRSADRALRTAQSPPKPGQGSLRRVKVYKRVGPHAPAKLLYVAQVAFWNEFGTVRAPPRPFFRGMIERQSPGWGPLMAGRLKANRFDAARTLDQMGSTINDQLRQSIVDLTSPPNAPFTIMMKGSAKPLVDTGQMLDSTSWKVDA